MQVRVCRVGTQAIDYAGAGAEGGEAEGAGEGSGGEEGTVGLFLRWVRVGTVAVGLS